MARAAPLLFVSTSGLSRRIHELERKLGVELLERSMHGVVLTPAGEQILLHAKKILEACDELFATAREAVAGPGWRRVVHMGIAPGVENSTRNRIVAAVTGADPDAVVALDPDANVHLIRKLIVGELDLAILHQRPLSPRSAASSSARSALWCAWPAISPRPHSRDAVAGRPDQPAVLQQHIAGGSGFGITFDSDESAWDNALVRTVVDLKLHLGTWVAWGRKAADDPALLAALARLREEYSAAFPADNGGAVLAAGR